MPARDCAHCGTPIDSTKLSTAIYCTRKCKMAASETRRPRRDNAARYLQEREHRLASAKAYYLRNPEAARLVKRKLKALAQGVEIYRFTVTDWHRLCVRHENRCYYCGLDRPLTMEHVIPVSRGGRHSVGNLVPACTSCNSSKGRRTVMEWRLAKLRRGGDSSSPGNLLSRESSRLSAGTHSTS